MTIKTSYIQTGTEVEFTPISELLEVDKLKAENDELKRALTEIKIKCESEVYTMKEIAQIANKAIHKAEGINNG